MDGGDDDGKTMPEEISIELLAKLSLHQRSGIPSDIAIDLFSKLTIKDLVRFKSVSKLWDRIICDPVFAKSYISDNSSSTNRLLFLDLENRKASVARLNPKSSYRAEREKDFPLPYEIGPEIKVLGYVDGLLCISSETREILLLNPSTRECRNLKLPENYAPSGGRSYYLAGIGYDKSTYDYKIVAIFFESNRSTENNRVMVFSLRENHWREVVGEFPYSLGCNDTHRVPVNGAIHWFVKDKKQSKVIVAFDLATEEVKEISFPDHGCYAEAAAEENCRVDLGAVEGRLALILHNQYDKKGSYYVHVWLMKEYGVRSSWTEMYLEGDFQADSEGNLRLVRQVSCWKGSVFISKDGRIWIGDAMESWRQRCIEREVDYGEHIVTPMGFRNTMIAFSASPVSPFGVN